MASSPRLPAVHASLLATALATVVATALLVPPMASAASALPASCSQPTVGGTVTCTFGFIGGTQTFTVPAGVTSVDLTAWGGHGARNFQSGSTPGGRGATVSGTFSVSPADQLTVTVGGDVSNPLTNATGAYGYGHGGTSANAGVGAGGGGGTAIAHGATVLLVAGAGGGAGARSSACPGGGAGGDAGQDGLQGDSCQGLSGGVGGISGGAPSSNGGNSNQTGLGNGGGGGGGGFLGGTGGESGDVSGGVITTSGGGGGGSSYADASGTHVSLTGLSDRGIGSNGLVQLTYEPSGPVTQVVLTPSQATVNAGDGQAFTAIGYDAGGASVADVTTDAVLSITPDGSCAGSTCTPSNPGPHSVTATYQGLTATADLDVTTPPVFTGSDSAVFPLGTAHDLTITTTGTPTPTLALTGGAIPDGLSFTDNGDGTATLGGTATTAGSVDLTVKATSSAGVATRVLHVLVGTTPAFTSPDHVTFVNGIGKVVTVSASGTPAPALELVDGTPPAGLSFTDNGDGTATLGGNASINGATELTVRASNSVGEATQVVHLLVGSPPSFTSADHAAFTVGAESSFTIEAPGSPAPALTLVNGEAPDGLSFTDNGDGTATLTGTLTGPGSADLTFKASNEFGDATQVLHVLVGTMPAFTSADSASFTRGLAGTMTVTVSGSPTPSIARDAGPRLPAGLHLVDLGDGTASISGTPTGRPVTTQVRLSGANVFGSASQQLTIVVAPLPGACANRFLGTSGPDRVRGTAAGDRLLGMAEDDTLLGFAGQDCLVGGAGRDGLFGDRGVDRLLGGAGNDTLVGGTGQDLLRGGAGDDVVKAADGQSDLVNCGSGHDTVVADRSDVLSRCETVILR